MAHTDSQKKTEPMKGGIKHIYSVLEESEREIILLKNMLKESNSSYELRPRVNELCFNNFDEMVMFCEECIVRDASKNYSDRQMEVLHNSGK